MRRSSYMAIGVVLAIVGAAALVWQKINYTERETVLDAGTVNITAQTRKSLPLPPILGGIALAGGVGLIVVGARRGDRPSGP